ncbi:hypothetical protein RND71_002225 [Anisodus tanguticus]|uniref:FAF domain-containing protein n=1 Tax=Anisodus tanguticus TaxID=243964 RepID=A0AAE1VRS1_9SOLA|nr:hypothetical protein RND71_002225 [Anisodus tanguticus]
MEEVATPQLSKPPLPKPNVVKEGIVSILGSDSHRGKSSAPSIRKTFSADMSSKQWLAQNGFFYPIKKIASSKDLVVYASDHSTSEEEEDELKSRKTSFDVWSSILSQKKDDNDMFNIQTPYIHPLVKRSTSSLSDKSLEICTENLGSENGSDGFSSYTPSEDGDVDEEKNDQQQQQQYCSQSFEESRVEKYNYSKRSSSFPPPIPSLARGENKPSLHMQSRRQDGRLILEAISVPPRNLFHAHRHDGRLLLTIVDNSTSTSSSELAMDDYGEEFNEVFYDIDEAKDNQTPRFDYINDDCPNEAEEPEIENGIKGMGIVMEQKPSLLICGAMRMKQVFNLTGSVGSTKMTEKLSQITSVPQSLPTQLTPTATTSFNAYEYFWRKKPTIASIVNTPTIAKECNNYTTKQVVLAANSTAPNAKSTTKVAAYEQKDLALMKGNRANMNYLVPLQSGCKEPRRSLLIWKPYCIATS